MLAFWMNASKCYWAKIMKMCIRVCTNLNLRLGEDCFTNFLPDPFEGLVHRDYFEKLEAKGLRSPVNCK